ncbi:AurF N-oxygenase family protein [Spirillospora sp. CA-253888]
MTDLFRVVTGIAGLAEVGRGIGAATRSIPFLGPRLAGRDGQVADSRAYVKVIDRLNKASVHQHSQAYVDVAWEDPEFQVDANDPRWVLSPSDLLGGTSWYRAQSPQVQAQIGLWYFANFMKIGLQFENLLNQGLLSFTLRMPNGSPEFRYLYHEIAEECQHVMMFQEFVNRTKLPVTGVPWALSLVGRAAPLLSLVSPELFFVFVLSGEEGIDREQRTMIKENRIKHPLAETLLRLHIAEEARHISFARHYLKHQVPELGRVRRCVFGLLTPVALGVPTHIMASPDSMARRFRIPRQVVDQAYRSPEARKQIRDSVGGTRDLMFSLGVITPLNKPMWKLMGIWDTPGAHRPGRSRARTGGEMVRT